MSLSDFWNRAKVINNLHREADRLFYDAVAEEMKFGYQDDGLWLMAYEKAQGDDKRAKALYIGLRVERLREQAELQSAAGSVSSRTQASAGEATPDNRTAPKECKYCLAKIQPSTAVCPSCSRVLRA